VSDTSFWVAYYRAVENERPDAIFKDPFAQKLVGEKGSRIAEHMGKISKYTQWSVVSRTIIIDRLIEKHVQHGVDVIINLGAGLDARPYRMSLPESLQWIEVDYARIIDYKNKILAEYKPKCQLTRTAVDLADDEMRKKFLGSVVPNAKRVLILTEGVIPYLTFEQVAKLATDLHNQKRFAFWITEYFHPRVYKYLKSTVRTKMKNAPFQFYPENWFVFFKTYGWSELETRFGSEVAKEFKRLPPMPWYARLLLPLVPEKIKQQARRLVGYVIFKRDE